MSNGIGVRFKGYNKPKGSGLSHQDVNWARQHEGGDGTMGQSDMLRVKKSDLFLVIPVVVSIVLSVGVNLLVSRPLPHGSFSSR